MAHVAATACKNAAQTLNRLIVWRCLRFASRAASAALRLPYPAQLRQVRRARLRSGLCFVFCVWGCFLCLVFLFGRRVCRWRRPLAVSLSAFGRCLGVLRVALLLFGVLAVRRGLRSRGCCGGFVRLVGLFGGFLRRFCRRSRVVACGGSRRGVGLSRSSRFSASVRRRVGCFGVPCFGRVFAAEGAGCVACLPSGGLFFYACRRVEKTCAAEPFFYTTRNFDFEISGSGTCAAEPFFVANHESNG